MQSTRWLRVSSDTVAWSRAVEDPYVVGRRIAAPARSPSPDPPVTMSRFRSDGRLNSFSSPEHGFEDFLALDRLGDERMRARS